MKGALAGLLALLLVVASAWAWFAGPCWLYSFSAAKDVPARCLMR
ncbi:hypothetical protein PP629_gp24 [Streptomyces phage Dubu]|uniref:Uncharacterized protein n=1 Tax=Streptomyces phage Dubu TaxID=2591226 RepID=A0A514DET9_9CAUD|nr:hypothetical protein PP629_gp24 [Streptomyces phage Dubu]QDH92129.1 hypothetical protein SEA_DUBU_24 [Streptomyces phage Dubu]